MNGYINTLLITHIDNPLATDESPFDACARGGRGVPWPQSTASAVASPPHPAGASPFPRWRSQSRCRSGSAGGLCTVGTSEDQMNTNRNRQHIIPSHCPNRGTPVAVKSSPQFTFGKCIPLGLELRPSLVQDVQTQGRAPTSGNVRKLRA